MFSMFTCDVLTIFLLDVQCVLLLKIVIEGIRGQSYAGDIAIDDLWIDDSPCPPEGCYAFSLYCLIISSHVDLKNIKGI